MDQDNSDDNATDYYSVRSESDNERITTKLHDNFIYNFSKMCTNHVTTENINSIKFHHYKKYAWFLASSNFHLEKILVNHNTSKYIFSLKHRLIREFRSLQGFKE